MKLKKVGKSFRVVFILMLGICISYVAQNTKADNFVDYGEIPWNEEKILLDNFAITLINEPSYTGTILYYSPKKSLTRAKFRVDRAKKYLISKWKIKADRIELDFGGEKEKMRFALLPQPPKTDLKDKN